MHEVWSQEMQCYWMRNAPQVRLKYTCFYLCTVGIVSGLTVIGSDGEKT